MRNASNALVTNAPVGVRVSILQGSADGDALYVETQSAVTNANGLLTLEIGGGKAEQGAFDRIDWASGSFFLKTETDPNGGENYGVTVTQQLLSVPYALYAKEAANGFSGDYNDLTNKPAIPQNVGELTNDAGYITLSDLPTQPKSGGVNDAGVIQTTTCGELDLCAMANQLAQQQSQIAQQQLQLARMEAVLLPKVSTASVSNVTETAVDCGGTVTANGYDAVTSRGVCWGTEPNPTVAGSHTYNGSGTGAFTCTLTGLAQGTTYYVRAYATNSMGTAYGAVRSFTTLVDTCPTITMPYSEDFESYTTSTSISTGVRPTCWELVQEDVLMSNSNRPQLCYKSSFAHSGNYSLKMGYRGVYAMPALSDSVEPNRVKLEMYLRQANAAYCLEVGVWEEDGTFVPVATFNNSTTDVERVVCSFANYSGSGRRIAFHNVLGGGASYNYSYNYLDDITLKVIPANAVVDENSCPNAPTVTDHEGNVYATVQIGNQCWMRDNLRTTHYADGTAIPAGGSNTSYTEPYYYDYSTHSLPLETRGYLYNWPAAMHGAASSSTNPSGVQGICPTGWHLPSEAEWTQLTDYVNSVSEYQCGGRSGNIAKALASTEGWNSYSGDCAVGNDPTLNNASGFSVVPAGYWSDGFGGDGFGGAGSWTYFWSSGQANSNSAWGRCLYYGNAYVDRGNYGKSGGLSVRCLRD